MLTERVFGILGAASVLCVFAAIWALTWLSGRRQRRHRRFMEKLSDITARLLVPSLADYVFAPNPFFGPLKIKSYKDFADFKRDILDPSVLIDDILERCAGVIPARFEPPPICIPTVWLPFKTSATSLWSTPRPWLAASSLYATSVFYGTMHFGSGRAFWGSP